MAIFELDPRLKMETPQTYIAFYFFLKFDKLANFEIKTTVMANQNFPNCVGFFLLHEISHNKIGEKFESLGPSLYL